VFVAAGIRWYYAGLMWGALGLTLGVFTFVRRTMPLGRYLAGSVALLLAAMLAFLGAAGPYAGVITSNLKRLRLGSIGSDVLNMTEIARTGFLMSGGGTNVVVPLRGDSAEGRAHQEEIVARQRATALYREQREAEAQAARATGQRQPQGQGGAAVATVPRPASQDFIDAQEDAARAIPTTRGEQVKMMAVGLGVVFLPTPLLKALAGVEIPAGRGFLSVADIDTLFIDLSILAIVVCMWRRRRDIGDHLPAVVFQVVLSFTTAVMLGYVVTNFGTLWRMRPLVAVPLWLLVIALSPRVRVPDAAPGGAAGRLSRQRPELSAPDLRL
jgi:hypothetical protein